MVSETPALSDKRVISETHAAHGHAAHDGHAEDHGFLHHHFDDMDQQRESTTLGMWAFLVTEIMMFGGLFFCYTLFRWKFGAAYAIGSHHLDWRYGAVNTGVLLVSSLTMAMAVHAAAVRDRKRLVTFLIVTMILGLAFLGIKAIEWTHDYHIGLVPSLSWDYYQRPENAKELLGLAQAGTSASAVQMFFIIYFCMTGLHAIHMVIGLAVLTAMIIMGARGAFTNGNDQPVELVGLYWHLVDIIWVFLFPLLYLIGGIKPMGGGH